jgi:hypothetical protein
MCRGRGLQHGHGVRQRVVEAFGAAAYSGSRSYRDPRAELVGVRAPAGGRANSGAVLDTSPW